MKKVLLVIVCQLITLNLFSQKLVDGSLDFLSKSASSSISVEWDFSTTSFPNDQTIEQVFTPIEQWKNNILPTILERFLVNLNKKASLNNVFFGKKEGDYKMIVAPDMISKTSKGTVRYIIKNKSSNTLAVISDEINGGLFGSLESLMGDAFEKAGEDLGDYLIKEIKNYITDDHALKGVRVLNYRFDYSKMTIAEMDAKDYIAIKVYDSLDEAEQLFQKFTKKMEITFISAANKESLIGKGCKLDNKDSLRFEVVICPANVDEDGAHTVNALLVDKKDNRIIRRFGISVGGGRFNNIKNRVIHRIKNSVGGRFNDFQTKFNEQLRESGEKFGDKLADDILND